jgi:hypothetical protein
VRPERPTSEDWDTWFGQRMAGVRETLSSAHNTRVNGELQKLRGILDPRSFELRIVHPRKRQSRVGRKIRRMAN